MWSGCCVQVLQKRRHSAAAEMLQQAVGSHEQSLASRQEEVRKRVADACQTQHDILNSAGANAAAAAAQAAQAAKSSAQAAKASAQAAAELTREAGSEQPTLPNDGVPHLANGLSASLLVGEKKFSGTSTNDGRHNPLRRTSHSAIHAANARLLEEVYRKCQLQERQIQQFRQQAEAVQMHSNEQTKLYQVRLCCVARVISCIPLFLLYFAKRATQPHLTPPRNAQQTHSLPLRFV